MSSMISHTGSRLSVLALVHEEDRLKGVEVRRHGGVLEVLWSGSSVAGRTDWGAFADESGVSSDGSEDHHFEHKKRTVVGFDAKSVAFYQLDVPVSGEKETDSIVRLQAESRLPLPAEQMQLVWRSGPTLNGQVTVTMAAAKRESLERFAVEVSKLRPARIILDCEGIVASWRTFFADAEIAEKAIIVSVEWRSTRVCLAEGGRLTNSAVVDMGLEAFSAHHEDSEETEVSERFAQDMRSVLSLFGFTEGPEPPVFVLTDGSGSVGAMVRSLEGAGLQASASMANTGRLGSGGDLGIEDVYSYRVPIGLAVMDLEDKSEGLDIFAGVYSPVAKSKKRRRLSSVVVAGVVCAVMVLAFMVVSYFVDVAKPGAIKKSLNAALSESDMDVLKERRALIAAVASERPDVLGLINLVNSCAEGGMKLNGLHFKKGQRVSVSGQAQNFDQVYKFEETLLAAKDISDVKRESASKAAKGGKIDFKVTFHYKTFTRKKR